MRYRESCLETAAKEMELSENLLNQLMPPHIHKAVRVGRPYGESCEVRTKSTTSICVCLQHRACSHSEIHTPSAMQMEHGTFISNFIAVST